MKIFLKMLIPIAILFAMMIYAITKPEPKWDKIYVKDMQITSTGVAILSCEEMKGERKVEFVLVIKYEDMGSKLYVGNLKYAKIHKQYVFVDADP